MRFLIVALLLLPTLALAAGKEKYSLKCELIAGGHCKKTCAESDVKLKQVEAMGGEKKGIIADVVCNEQGKDYLCCVEKDKLMK
jgi:hypothetical protein